MIVSILNQKGGVGKTTLAINLARYFTKQGDKTLLVDSDTQGSITDWDGVLDDTLVQVNNQITHPMTKPIKQLAADYQWIFIDGVPHLSRQTGLAVSCADIVLIPVAPSALDVWAAFDLIEIIKTCQTERNGKPKTAFVINRQVKNTRTAKGLRESLKPYGLPIFESSTSSRVAYSDSINAGKTVFEMPNAIDAIREIGSIAKELKEMVNDIN